MCARGPTISGTNLNGQVIQRPDRSFEGALVQVLAISAPIFLIRVYPMPCGDVTHDHTPYVTPSQFNYMGWSRPPRRYVREYMKAAKHVLPARQRMAGVVNKHDFNALMEQMYQSGSSPETGSSFNDEREDDGQGTPTE
jgi:hypothetical protein